MREYLLQNKDKVVLRFGIERTVIAVNFHLLSSIDGPLPIGFKTLSDWLDSRFILTHRLQIESLFKQLGIEYIEDYIPITYCVSLTDSYWVQEVGQNKKWSEVSPYTNPLNKVVSEFSFNGKINGKYIGSSPDFSTAGMYPKCWLRFNDKLHLCKAGTEGFGNSGLEPFSEIFAYQLGIYLDFNVLEYFSYQHKNKDCTLCEIMTSESVGLKSFAEVTGIAEADYRYFLNWIKDNLTSIDYNQSVNMLLLDVLTCNTDRHYGNIGMLVNNDTQKVIGLAPIFDNNQSCIPYYTNRETVEFYTSDILAKDGRTFTEVYRLIASSYTKALLIKAKRFRFQSIGISKADERLFIVNKMLQLQIDRCLSVHSKGEFYNE